MSALPVKGEGRRDLTFEIADSIILPYPLNTQPCRVAYTPEATLPGVPPIELTAPVKGALRLVPPERSPERAQPYRVELLGTEEVPLRLGFWRLRFSHRLIPQSPHSRSNDASLLKSRLYPAQCTSSITSMLQIPTVTQVGHSDRHPQLF